MSGKGSDNQEGEVKELREQYAQVLMARRRALKLELAEIERQLVGWGRITRHSAASDSVRQGR